MTAVWEPDVQCRAQMALANSPIYELRDLRVEFGPDNETLVLSGAVSSFYHKQLAQEVVRAVCRHMELELVNAVRVR